MQAKKITDSVYSIHADIEGPNIRFEGLWLIPNGVSINSYIVKGEKTALIDMVKDWNGSLSSYKEQLQSIGLDFSKFDYIILNHLEPDHLDALGTVYKENPEVEIISTAKGIAMVKNFFKVEGNFRIVKDGEQLELGNGKTLRFYETPNIHWPETMMTYDINEKILFSCDAFGSYRCLGDRIFSDEYTKEELLKFENAALQYYSNIVAGFSSFVNKGIAKLEQIPIDFICPSHGLVYRKNADDIINLYKKFAGYNTAGKCEKEICIIWGSMYGYTKNGLDAVIQGVEEENIPYSIHQIPQTDASIILAEAYKSAGLILAMPTYEYKMFPPMAHLLDLFERKHFTNKKVLRIGSWGWVGGAKREYDTVMEKFKWTNIEAFEWQGVLTDNDIEILKKKGKELAALIKAD